jgi:hypothetical protein
MAQGRQNSHEFIIAHRAIRPIMKSNDRLRCRTDTQWLLHATLLISQDSFHGAAAPLLTVLAANFEISIPAGTRITSPGTG